MSDPDHKDEICFISRGRYVSVEGSFIESCANNANIVVPAHMVQNRIKRDGLQEHHLTFINPFELKDAASKLDIKKKAASRIIERIQNEHGFPSTWEPPIDLGTGRILGKDNAVTLFKVIHWPAGQAIRQNLGLGHAFLHVTLGFDPADIHQYKGPGSLDTLNGISQCSHRDIEQLTSLQHHYHGDGVFMKRLAIQCWKTGFYRWAFWLTFRYSLATIKLYMTAIKSPRLR
ncbi:hypothetical protein K450DRAFT_228500 [Umbelopsis ramanniana AG]|uniref:Swiss Army Knife 2H phosphoesterase domain-containing protein n=1 Tax=Umbelopsis ramanniana AG TaxID=1314678 RepID=A0AAD5HHL6_UMBRA|nr:uncharacterized protein K450DRAFT_228500 [Umbelopsis ramanniana AG]KAI8582333.1 hypothetical protein K450DRAFT_228500 [Umbelopsis ramanniana AG]